MLKSRYPAPFKNSDTILRVTQTLEDIVSGTRHHVRDGITFHNREGLLPSQPPCYYKEFTVRPPSGVTARGAERLVVGEGGEIYYTPNHYADFARIQ